jgi:serine/threonine protein kinase
MSPVTSLVCFGLRQVLGDVANIIVVVEQHLIDHSTALTGALATANNKAWRALAVSLAGDGICDRVKVWLTTSGDEKGFREQVHRLLATQAIPHEGSSEAFRKLCLAELNQALKARELSAEGLPHKEIASQTANFQRYADPQALVKGAEQAVVQVANALLPRYPNLARLLGHPTPSGPPLLAAAFSYFFRREVEKDDELANGLMFDGLKQLSAAQAKSFGEVSKALDGLGERFDQAFDEMAQELERTRKAAEEARQAAEKAREAAERARKATEDTQGAVLDLQSEQQRLGGLQLERVEEVRSLLLDVQRQLANAGMQRGEVKPRYSLSIRGDEERRAVHTLLDRFRQLPEEQRSQLPALLNGLGKLQVGIGEFEPAKQAFRQVAAEVSDTAAKAEAFHNAYLAAVEKEQWGEALEAITQAAALNTARFSPFPLDRYRPVRILGAGGFGTAVLCHDRHFDEEVVIKTLHMNDLDRSMTDVFREARILHKLNHPAIIRVRDCAYADGMHQARPYLVMDLFQGVSLEKFIRDRGTLSTDQLLVVARQVAEGMKEAHSQGILHRDLKPDNVLVRKEGDQWHVKIIDFGLAMRRETVEAGGSSSSGKSILGQSMAGTLKFAPPEQLGELPDVKPGPYSDVYSFGKMCYSMLFGTPQPDYDDLDGLAPPWKELLRRCTAQKIDKRPKDFAEVLAALEPPKPAETVQIRCPQCRVGLKIPIKLLGKTIKCPKCTGHVVATQSPAHGSAPKTATSAHLVSSLNPGIHGRAVIFTATVNAVSHGSTPTGTVTFKDGAVVIGSETLSNGIATLTTAALSAGNHDITALYIGDGLFAPSVSPALTQAVTPVPLTVTAVTPPESPPKDQMAEAAEDDLDEEDEDDLDDDEEEEEEDEDDKENDFGGIPARPRPATKAVTFQKLADATQLSKQQVAVLVDELAHLIQQELSKKGPGVFNLSGLVKIKRVEKQATKDRPKRTVVRAVALKALKDLAKDDGQAAEPSATEREFEQDRPARCDTLRRFWERLLRRPKAKNTRHANLSPPECAWIAAGSGVRGLPFVYAIQQDKSKVELYIDRGSGRTEENKELFDRLEQHKEEIEKTFGSPLSWQRLDDKQACRIAYIMTAGGWKSPESEWPAIQDAMIDAMIRLEKALMPDLAKMKAGLERGPEQVRESN